MSVPFFTLIREASTPEGTPGILCGSLLPGPLQTIELPWLDNRPEVSCIPPGDYIMKWMPSAKYKRPMLTLLNVPGRSGILFHTGNFAGDTTKGWRTDSNGCIFPGMERGSLEHAARQQRVVLRSGLALESLEAAVRTLAVLSIIAPHA